MIVVMMLAWEGRKADMCISSTHTTAAAARIKPSGAAGEQKPAVIAKIFRQTENVRRWMRAAADGALPAFSDITFRHAETGAICV